MKFRLTANSPHDVSLEIDGQKVDLSRVTGITLRLNPDDGIEMFVAYFVDELEAEGEGEVVAT